MHVDPLMNYNKQASEPPLRRKARNATFVACALGIVGNVTFMFRPEPVVVKTGGLVALIGSILCIIYATVLLVRSSRA